MKIAIIGGGIAGCAAYLELQKHLPKSTASEDHEIVIYEAYSMDANTTADQRTEENTHSSTLLIGGGLGIAPNGLNVLKRLDEDLLKEVVQGGYVTANSNMKNKSGWSLFSMSNACSENDRNLYMVATSRHAFWRALRVRVPSEHIINKRICEVVAQPDGMNLIHFADGSPSVEADLVLGADGVRSTVKRALFPDTNEDPYPPHYE
jgi:2-polyprenyl-6-methoxyphenol hydroxylase-like FAD-dependent oxidoreductase